MSTSFRDKLASLKAAKVPVLAGGLAASPKTPVAPPLTKQDKHRIRLEKRREKQEAQKRRQAKAAARSSQKRSAQAFDGAPQGYDPHFAAAPVPDDAVDAIAKMVASYRYATQIAIRNGFSETDCGRLKTFESKLILAINALRWEYGYAGVALGGKVYVVDAGTIEGWDASEDGIDTEVSCHILDLDDSIGEFASPDDGPLEPEGEDDPTCLPQPS